MTGPTVLAFDVYGTLLDTSSIKDKLASHIDPAKAETVALAWRKYQLEYTWRLNSMGQYRDFTEVTRQSLRHALAESSASVSDQDLQDLMHAYDSLDTFDDVAPALKALGSMSDQITPVLFSNGTYDMIANSVRQSPKLQDFAQTFRSFVVVEEVKCYKPAPEVYAHLARNVGRNPAESRDMAEMWLISGNPFDIVGARSRGMQAVWLDRAGNGWQDALIEGPEGRPTVIVQSLEELPALFAAKKS